MGLFGSDSSNLGKQIAKRIVEGIVGGVVSTALGIVVGLAANNLLYGLVIGVVVGMLILVAFAVKAIQIAASVPQRDDISGAGSAAAQLTPTAADSDQAQELERLRSENKDLQAEKAALQKELEEAQPTGDESQSDDEELKQRCRELAENLHEFLENYAWDDVARAEAQDADLYYEIARADTETMRQFRKSLRPEVMRMVAELKRRGWWKQEDFDLPDWEAVESPDHPDDLELIANHLERLGYSP
jgi:hypothetical protein